jgi:hypothetical protein
VAPDRRQVPVAALDLDASEPVGGQAQRVVEPGVQVDVLDRVGVRRA